MLEKVRRALAMSRTKALPLQMLGVVCRASSSNSGQSSDSGSLPRPPPALRDPWDLSFPERLSSVPEGQDTIPGLSSAIARVLLPGPLPPPSATSRTRSFPTVCTLADIAGTLSRCSPPRTAPSIYSVSMLPSDLEWTWVLRRSPRSGPAPSGYRCIWANPSRWRLEPPPVAMRRPGS